MSLCGVSFFSGILSKEIILDIIFINRLRFFLLIFLVFSIYLTFAYCYLIYISCFLYSFCTVVFFHKRIFALLLPFFHYIIVLCYYSWMSSNISVFDVGFPYFEGFIFLLFMFLFVIIVIGFVYIGKFRYNLFF